MMGGVADAILNVHAISTLMLAGLIWVIQLVHYPLLERVGAEAFPRYQHEHMRRITWLVAPLMLVEGMTAIAIVVLSDDSVSSALAWVGVVLVLLNAGSTALLQVPCHARLTRGFDAVTLRRLVATNWLRTVAWSVRGVVAVALLRLASG